jgi:hypothetical protein
MLTIDAQADGREPLPDALIVYKRAKVATVKRAIRRVGAELGLAGFSQYGFRHFKADQVKRLFRIPGDRGAGASVGRDHAPHLG